MSSDLLRPSSAESKPEPEPSSSARYCCVKGCTSEFKSRMNRPIHYYCFPTSKFEWRNERRIKWKRAVIKHNQISDDWEPKRRTVICSAHFAGGSKNEHPQHPAYNPTIFPGDPVDKEAQSVSKFLLNLQKVEKSSKVKKQKMVVSSTVAKAVTKGSIKLPEDIGEQVKLVEKVQKKSLVIAEDTSEELLPEHVEIDGNFIINQNDVSSIIEKRNDPPKGNDVTCQVCFIDGEPLNDLNIDYAICNLRTENGICCAETQISSQHNRGRRNYTKSKDQAPKSEPLSNIPWLQEIKFSGIASIHHSDHLLDMCGVSFDVFNLLLKDLPQMARISISQANRLLIFLMKLKQGISYTTLAILFNLPLTILPRVFTETLQSLAVAFESQVYRPNRSTIIKNMPESFKSVYPNCRGIIDCIELQREIPEKAQDKLHFYSVYKNCSSFKVFLIYAPNGFVMYKSKCYSDERCDEFIAKYSKFLDFINTPDVILADKNFPSIRAVLESKGVVFVTPPFTENPELPSISILTRQIIHKIKIFKILSFIPLELVSHIDEILQVCCSLINLEIKMKQT